MRWWVVLAVLASAAVVVDRLLLWMEWRGWIDYRRTYPGRIQSGQVGPAVLGIQALFQSGAHHHLEEKTAVRTEREGVGAGGGGDGDPAVGPGNDRLDSPR